MHVVRSGGGEEDDRALQIIGRAPAAGRDAREDVAAAHRIVAQGLGVVSGHVAGGDGVDVDTMRRELVREGAGEAEDAALRGGVGDDADASLKREHRGDVDDLPAALLLDEAPCEVAREGEDGAEIHFDDRVPIVVAGVDEIRAADDAGVVDEDVGVAGSFEKCAHRGAVAEVCIGGGRANDARARLFERVRHRAPRPREAPVTIAVWPSRRN